MAYLKMLRQYPVGRWALYQVVLTAIALMLKRGVFDVIIWSGVNSSRRQKGESVCETSSSVCRHKSKDQVYPS